MMVNVPSIMLAISFLHLIKESPPPRDTLTCVLGLVIGPCLVDN